MSLCSAIPTGPQYNCSNPWGDGCTNNGIFQFTTLWNITANIYHACANDSRLYNHEQPNPSLNTVSLTQEACTAIVGPGWTWYPRADIFARMTSWRFPLFQLVATFPRPPLSFNVNLFVILHLLGDPIDTIRNLLVKLTECETRALYWRREFDLSLRSLAGSEKDRDWKAVTIITEAYNEWNEAGTADEVFRRLLGELTEQRHSQRDTMAVIRHAAELLAADRATKFLPIVSAQIIFIGAIAIAFAKTAAAAGSNSPAPTVFINVEAHSIAFSALYFWIIPAVIMASVIGVSQTEHAIPRILGRLQEDLDRVFPSKYKLPNDYIHDKLGRVVKGGIYSWQPADGLKPSHPSVTAMYQSPPSGFEPPRKNSYKSIPQVVIHTPDDTPLHPLSPTPNPLTRLSATTKQTLTSPALFALLVLLSATGTGILVSYLVPPSGFDCRHVAQALITLLWLLSALADFLLQRLLPARLGHHHLRFWLVFTKDLLSTALTVGGVMYAHVGVFNRCACYTNWGRAGLALPAMPRVKAILVARIERTYPAITFSGIIFQLVFVPVFVLVSNRHAVRVFLQSDHGSSNAGWLWRMRHRVQRRQWPGSPTAEESMGYSLQPARTRGDPVREAGGGGRRRMHPFQRLNSDEIALVDYSSRNKMRDVS